VATALNLEQIDAITLDLDDTLWDVWSVIGRAEQKLWAHINEHHPEVGSRYNAESLREAKDIVAAEHPDLLHDMTEMRRLSLVHAFKTAGGDVSGVDDAMALFLHARNDVVFFDDAMEGLERIAARLPMLAVSNGNADINAIGIDHLFKGAMSSITAGVSKPHPDIFLKACDVLSVAPSRTLHVGDHPHQDVDGAHNAGLKTAWINRNASPWSGDTTPDIVAVDMLELADCLLGS